MGVRRHEWHEPTPTPATPEQFAQIVREAIATASKIIKDVGIKVE